MAKQSGYQIGTLISSIDYHSRRLTVADSPYSTTYNQRYYVNTSGGSVDLSFIRKPRDNQRIVIVDDGLNFDQMPVVLTDSNGNTFNQTGTDEFILGYVGVSDEWILRYWKGVWYTEHSPGAPIPPINQMESQVLSIDSQAVFSLTGEITDPASLLIFYNGWKIPASYYSLSGQVVTFSPLPIIIHAGSTIEFYYD